MVKKARIGKILVSDQFMKSHRDHGFVLSGYFQKIGFEGSFREFNHVSFNHEFYGKCPLFDEICSQHPNIPSYNLEELLKQHRETQNAKS